jgi:HAD superfamily hydrolase (TIGR01549 family)
VQTILAREIRRRGIGNGGRPVIERLHAQRLRAKAAPFARLDDAVLAMLRELKGLGLRLGLISNCAAEEVAAWDASPLRPYFDDAVFSYVVGCAKPDPAVYALACERLGAAPARCLFVGDGGSDELAGAGRAGLRPAGRRGSSNGRPTGRSSRPTSDEPPILASGRHGSWSRWPPCARRADAPALAPLRGAPAHAKRAGCASQASSGTSPETSRTRYRKR